VTRRNTKSRVTSSGSLSSLVVPLERWRTDPREPLSREVQGEDPEERICSQTQDGCQAVEQEPEGDQPMAPETLASRHQGTMADTDAETKGEPYALIGLVRVCGGASCSQLALPGSLLEPGKWDGYIRELILGKKTRKSSKIHPMMVQPRNMWRRKSVKNFGSCLHPATTVGKQ
jgi:hypothetical protein